MFVSPKFLVVLWCTIIFTLLTSSVYLINDIADLQRDKLHPFKKKRPIASGKLPIPTAIFLAVVGFIVAFYLAYSHDFFFFLVVLSYFLLQMTYTFRLKHIIVVDVLAIAAGFGLRVYAGAFAINVHMNVWFLLCLTSLSLFMAVGKRRAELAILTEKTAPRHRKTLTFYSPKLLDTYLAMFANSTWLTYALFTFFFPPVVTIKRLSLLAALPLTLTGTNKWLMATIPLVIFSVMRYMNIIYQGSRAESPEKVLLSDRPLLATTLIWGIMVVAIIYGVRP